MNTSIKYIILANVRYNDSLEDKLTPNVSNQEIICTHAHGIDTMTPSEQAAFIFGWLSRDRHYNKQYPVEIKFSVYNTNGDVIDATLTDTSSEEVTTEEVVSEEASVEKVCDTQEPVIKNNNATCFGLLEPSQQQPATEADMLPLASCMGPLESAQTEDLPLPAFTQAPSEFLTIDELSRLYGLSTTTINRKIRRARLEPAMVIRGKRVFDAKKALAVFKSDHYSLLVKTKLNPAKCPEAFIDFAYMVKEHKITRNTLDNLIAMGLPGVMAYKKVTPQVFEEVDSPPYKYVFEKEAYYKLYNDYINNEL
jgi:hypothetical protein